MVPLFISLEWNEKEFQVIIFTHQEFHFWSKNLSGIYYELMLMQLDPNFLIALDGVFLVGPWLILGCWLCWPTGLPGDSDPVGKGTPA